MTPSLLAMARFGHPLALGPSQNVWADDEKRKSVIVKGYQVDEQDPILSQ